jgi:hypothetical protein
LYFLEKERTLIKMKPCKIKTKKIIPPIAPPAENKIGVALLQFEYVIHKCLEDRFPVLDEYSVSMCRKTRKDGQIERFYRYLATFKYGPFYTQTLTIDKKFVVLPSEHEVVNLVFNALSSDSEFEFNFAKTNFKKRMVFLG